MILSDQQQDAPVTFEYDGFTWQLSDLPELARELLEVVGPEPAFKLLAYLGGQQHYFPNLTNLKAAVRRARIINDWKKNGITDVGTLARKHGVSFQTVYELIRKQQTRKFDA